MDCNKSLAVEDGVNEILDDDCTLRILVGVVHVNGPVVQHRNS